MDGASVRFFRNSLIISLAFSVTSNIFSSLCGGALSGASPVNMAYNYARRYVLSICNFSCFPLSSMNSDRYANWHLTLLSSVKQDRGNQASFRSPDAISCKPVRSRMDI